MNAAALGVDCPLYIWNMVFIAYYVVELICKIWAQGWKLYFWSVANVYEGIVMYLCFCVVNLGASLRSYTR